MQCLLTSTEHKVQLEADGSVSSSAGIHGSVFVQSVAVMRVDAEMLMTDRSQQYLLMNVLLICVFIPVARPWSSLVLTNVFEASTSSHGQRPRGDFLNQRSGTWKTTA